MLDKNFDRDYLLELHKSYVSCDPSILEKTIHALALLEALSKTGLNFIFKGGTSLILLLSKPCRLSTDIDIIVNTNTNIEEFIDKIDGTNSFIKHEEQIRKQNGNIKKRHFKFFYSSKLNPSINNQYILLDVLYEENHYSKLVKVPLKNSLIVSVDTPVLITMPNKESLLADKLTAFAPHTTGIKIGDKNLEVMKQFYDVKSLIEEIKDFNFVKDTYIKIAKQEISYRGLSINYKDCLIDTINSCICIASKGNINKEDYDKYLNGIRTLRNHIFNEKYSMEQAALDAASIIYCACCLLYDTDFNIQINIDKIETYKLESKELHKLNYIKKISMKSYSFLAKVDMLIKYNNYINP